MNNRREKPMNRFRKNLFTWMVAGFFGLSTLGCGYILYPERRNTQARGGQLDAVVLVMDLLWLIPGILPGVIALVWDGIHGSWYVPGSQAPMLGQNPQAVPHLTAQRPIEIRPAAGSRLRLQDSAGHLYEMPLTVLSRGRSAAHLPAQAARGPASLIVTQGSRTHTLPVIID